MNREPFALRPLVYLPDAARAAFAEHDQEFLFDESGEVRRAALLSAREFERAESFVLTPAYVAALDWSLESERMLLVQTEQQAAAVYAAYEDCETYLGKCIDASQDGLVGLVSVLSTQKLPKKGPPPGSAGFLSIDPPDRERASLDANKRNPAPGPVHRARQERAMKQANAVIVGTPEQRLFKLRAQIGFAARAHGAGSRKGFRPDELLMLTLTYAPGTEWQANHVRALMDHVRKWHKRQGIDCRYVWVCESQDGKRRRDKQGRKVPHYHVLLWVPQGTRLPMPDKQGWWPHGATRIEVANRAAAYLLSYLKKDDSKNLKDMPDGCRIYSVGGLDHAMRRARRWLGLPAFVQARASLRDDWRRAPVGTGGGWIDPDGTRWPSEFQPIRIAGAMGVVRVRTHPRPADPYGPPAGPFEWIKDRPVVEVAVPEQA